MDTNRQTHIRDMTSNLVKGSQGSSHNMLHDLPSPDMLDSERGVIASNLEKVAIINHSIKMSPDR